MMIIMMIMNGQMRKKKRIMPMCITMTMITPMII